MSSPPDHVTDERDWTSLPPEMVLHISQFLRLVPDFIRFRSMCPKWRAAATVSPSHLPWLLIDLRLPIKIGEPPKTGDLKLYSLLTKHIHNVSVPKAKGKPFSGPGNQYILSSTDKKWRQNWLLNPLTGSEISLPILSCDFGRLVVGPNPFYNREYMGSYQSCRLSGILFSRKLAEGDWKTFQFDCGDKGQGHTFYKGKYYIYDGKSQELRVVDMDTGSIESVLVLPPESSQEKEDNGDFNYLIESFGELLRVSKCERSDDFKIYYVDVDCENLRWIKKNSIGDVMIFLYITTGFSLRACDFPGFYGNCIYYIKHSCVFYRGYHISFLCKYYLDDGTVEVLRTPIYGDSTWFVPSL